MLSFCAVFAATLVARFALMHVGRRHWRTSNCAAFHTSFSHFNTSFTLSPLNPHHAFSDRVVLSFHTDATLLPHNNADCHLHLHRTGSADDAPPPLPRVAAQTLKPHVLAAVLRVLPRPVAHMAYIDHDANFISWPRRPSRALVVQAAPWRNHSNTGTLILFHARSHAQLLARWQAVVVHGRADQEAWWVMERQAAVQLQRSADGEFAENYNWNTLHRVQTTRRCRRVIAVLRQLAWLGDAFVAALVITRVTDLAAGHMPAVVAVRAAAVARRLPAAAFGRPFSEKHVALARWRLQAFVMLAAVASVVFRGDYFTQRDVVADKYLTDRVCAVPELGITYDGTLVTRRFTTPGPNAVLSLATAMLGLPAVASGLSVWFHLLEFLRRVARVSIALHLVAALVTKLTTRRKRSVLSDD